MANKSMAGYKRVLKPNGALVVIGGTVSTLLKLAFSNLILREKKLKLLGYKISPDDLNFLAELLDGCKLKSIVDKVFDMEDILDAFHHYHSGEFIGKIVINTTAQPGK